MYITKTDYLEYTFCRKNLWLKKHKPEIFESLELSDFEKKIIEEGNVELIVSGKTSTDNVEDVCFKLEPPESFGALTIGYDLRRLSSARCVTDCTLLGFYNPDFETLKKRNPKVAVKFLESVSILAMRQLERTVRELETETNTQNAFSIHFQTYYDRFEESTETKNETE
jgi:CRP-like cAMP-binding protein